MYLRQYWEWNLRLLAHSALRIMLSISIYNESLSKEVYGKESQGYAKQVLLKLEKRISVELL